jgi:tRNA U34 5-methylaminomethyl-2-thiouridine-forming methyltransferase MnmC
MSWLGLAEFYHHKDVEKAHAAAETAVQKALAANKMVRNAYHTRARIARSRQDYALLRNTLLALIDYGPARRDQVDIGYEDDFLDALPPDVIDPELLRKYRSLRQPK